MTNYKTQQQFGSYLAGLFEGDGNIHMYRKIYPHFSIGFHSNNLPFIKALRARIGYGQIVKRKNKPFHVLNISTHEGVAHIIELINGKLKTPKIRQLDLAIDALNQRYGYNIVSLPLCRKPLDATGWFAGFVDAEGCFYVKNVARKGRQTRNIACRFILVQKIYDNNHCSSQHYLNSMAEFLNVKLNTVKSLKNPQTYFVIEASSLRSRNVMRTYFKRFSLLSSKRLDYELWSRACDVLAAKSLQIDLNEQINLLKQSMNSKRKNFHWDHLNAF